MSYVADLPAQLINPEYWRSARNHSPDPAETILRKHAGIPRMVTDPDSRIMKSSEGFVQGYDAQAVVDHGSHLIVSQDVSNAAND